MSKNAKYRVGIIGCGSHGTRLGRAFNLNPMTEVVAGVNRSQEGLDLFCGRFDVPGYHDYKEMLEKEDIDIAASILPVKHNPQAVIDCAHAGVKGIFCDKPIAASLEEADRMVEECRELKVPVVAGDMFRNDPDMWKARGLVESGEIGEVITINVYGTGGNQGSGQGCRSFTDMAMFAGDREIDWVVGWVTGDPADSKLVEVDEWSDNDQGMGGYLRYASGIECFLHTRTGAGRARHRGDRHRGRAAQGLRDPTVPPLEETGLRARGGRRHLRPARRGRLRGDRIRRRWMVRPQKAHD